jgi:hypothetical protein
MQRIIDYREKTEVTMVRRIIKVEEFSKSRKKKEKKKGERIWNGFCTIAYVRLGCGG